MYLRSAPPDQGAVSLSAISGLVGVAFLSLLIGVGIWGEVSRNWDALSAAPRPFSSKLNWLERHAEIDTVFIGSSRFFHGISPTAFDTESARRGRPTQSFNLAFDAINFPELRYLVDRVLANPSLSLRYLIIEPSLRARLAPGLEESERALALHDWRGSFSVLRLIALGNHEWWRKAFWFGEHVRVSATRLGNVGVFSERFLRSKDSTADGTDDLGLDEMGFVGLRSSTARGTGMASATVPSLVSVESNRQVVGRKRRLNGFEIRELTDLQQRAASRGVRLILLTPPTLAEESYEEFSAVKAAERGGALTVPLLYFTDPARSPDLYTPAGFVDADHLSEAAAKRWSISAADAFVQSLDGGR